LHRNLGGTLKQYIYYHRKCRSCQWEDAADRSCKMWKLPCCGAFRLINLLADKAEEYTDCNLRLFRLWL